MNDSLFQIIYTHNNNYTHNTIIHTQDLELNRTTIPPSEEDGETQDKTYDLHPNDRSGIVYVLIILRNISSVC